MSELAPEAPVEPAADPAAEAPPAAETWTPPREEWEQIAGAVAYLADLEQRRSSVYQPEPEEQTFELDPFSENFGEGLRRLIREETAPLATHYQSMTAKEGEERARDILADIASREGEFDLDMARTRANQLLPSIARRMGNGPKAAEAALEQAAKEQREWEAKFAETAVKRHLNQLETLAGAPGEPGSTYSQGVQQRVMPDYTKGGSVTGKFFGRNAEA